MNVYLIGYRGTGKTTVARLLADNLGWKAVDSDEEIVRRSGTTIAEIFATEGETGFRDREAQVIAELCEGDRMVVALGGGAIVRAENRQMITRQGLTIWLQASPQTLYNRISSDPSTSENRPNLSAVGGEREIHDLLGQRLPLYQTCADLEIDTESQTPQQVAHDILPLVSNHFGLP